MRYIKPPDFKSVREFQAYYQEIEQEITELLTKDGSARTAKELQALTNKALTAAVKYLTQKNKEYVKKELPQAFQEGKDTVNESVKISAAEASKILEKKGFIYAKSAFAEETYIELQTSLLGAVKGLNSKVDGIIKDLAKENKDTVYNVQQAILKEYQENGLFTVEYSNGAKQPIHAYAAMVARSARIESTNIGAIGRALQSGTDYVKMTEVSQCCKLCGAYQGKVYSISGKDKRFPSLFDTVLKRKYALPHPNCRHEFVAWYIDMEDEADVKKAIEKSKILYDNKGELVDVRFQKDIKGYAEWQAGNRQRNEEFKQYEAMKAYYENKGEEVPYKTLAGFRRAKRAQSVAYLENRKEWGENQKQSKKAKNQQTNSEEISEKRLTLWTISGNLGKESNPNAKVDCAVDWKDINTKHHKDALIKLTGSRNVGLTIAKIERDILTHRDGTEHEDLYLLDARSGRVVDKNTVSTILLGTYKTEKMTQLLQNDDSKEYILVHNHPYSSRPSASDLNSLLENPKVKYGIIIGHDGTLYKYTKPKEIVIDLAIASYVKKSRTETEDELSARKLAYQRLMEKYEFTLEEG